MRDVGLMVSLLKSRRTGSGVRIVIYHHWIWNVHGEETIGLEKQLKVDASREGAMPFTTNLSGLMDL